MCNMFVIFKKHFSLFNDAKYCDQRLCLSVCLNVCESALLLACLKNYMSKSHEIFVHIT